MSKSWLNYNSFNTTLGSQTYDLAPEWGFPTFLITNHMAVPIIYKYFTLKDLKNMESFKVTQTILSNCLLILSLHVFILNYIYIHIYIKIQKNSQK